MHSSGENPPAFLSVFFNEILHFHSSERTAFARRAASRRGLRGFTTHANGHGHRLLHADRLRLNTGRVEWDVFVKGTNLTNQEVRLSTSFLKDVAPLGGRGVVVGLKANF